MNESRDSGRIFAAAIALLAAFALGLQYAILIGNTHDTVWVASVRFFSYFTILSNLLVLLVTGTTAVMPQTHWGRWFARPIARGAVALYIAITLSIYAVVLSQLWQPQGAQWWADSSLHYGVPIAYLLWWVFAVPHGTLRWRDVANWLLFPAGYLVWVLLRGAWAKEYPYPFLDLTVLDGWIVVRNCAGVLLLFVIGGGLLLLVDRWRAPNRGPVTA